MGVGCVSYCGIRSIVISMIYGMIIRLMRYDMFVVFVESLGCVICVFDVGRLWDFIFIYDMLFLKRMIRLYDGIFV